MRALAAAVALSFASAAAAAAAEFQTYIEYRIVPENVNAPPRDASKVWRVGTRYARIEEPPDPKSNIRMVVIINEPDIYMIDLTANRGRHMKDPDSNGKVHIPIFNHRASGAIMEIGQELEFFKAHDASREKDAMLGDVKCAVFRLMFDRQELKLYVDLEARAPHRIKIKAPNSSYSIFYDQYVRKEPVDLALYQPPENIELVEGDAPIEKRPVIETPFTTLPDIEAGWPFYASTIGGVLDLNTFICRARPVVVFYFDPDRPGGQKVAEHIADLYRQYRRTQACFIPIPRRGGGVKASVDKFDFPVYRLDSSGGVQPLNMSSERGFYAMAFDLAGKATKIPGPRDESFTQFDDAIKTAVDKRLPNSEGEHDLKTEIGDMSAQWTRVDGELSDEKTDHLKVWLDERKFAELDRYFADVRKRKSLAPNGSWKLNAAHRALGGSDPDDDRLLKRMEIMREWIGLYPESVTPRVVLGKLWLDYAWRGRGGDYGDKLTVKQRTLFAERLSEAKRVLMEARELDEKCPELYVVMLKLAMGEGWPRDEIDTMFLEGQKLEPQYQYLYMKMAYLLMPKWYGKPGEWEEFARRISAENPGGHGDELYARIALLMAGDNGNDFNLETLFTKTSLSWPLVKRGEEAIRARFPRSKMNANFFAFMACAAGDKKTAREVFQRIGEDYAITVWGNRVVYEHSRRWANRP